WLKAVVTDPARPAHLQEQLREAYPHLLVTEYAPEGREAHERTPVVRREQNPLEAMEDFLAHVTGAAPTAAEHDVMERAHTAARGQREASSTSTTCARRGSAPSPALSRSTSPRSARAACSCSRAPPAPASPPSSTRSCTRCTGRSPAAPPARTGSAPSSRRRPRRAWWT